MNEQMMNEHLKRLVVRSGALRIGDRFDKLRVLGTVFKARVDKQWEKLHVVCECRCGEVCVVQINDLQNQKVRSCGCRTGSLARSR